jgi:acetoin utilization deacetylase AcuC-like enzyme
LNLPIPALSGDQAYLALTEEVILPYLDRQAPEILLVSFGFDTHWRDPLGSMLVSAGCVHKLISSLSDWSQQNCEGRIAVILEGGYDLEAGRVCGQAVGAALLQDPFQDTLGASSQPEGMAWQETLRGAAEILARAD